MYCGIQIGNQNAFESAVEATIHQNKADRNRLKEHARKAIYALVEKEFGGINGLVCQAWIEYAKDNPIVKRLLGLRAKDVLTVETVAKALFIDLSEPLVAEMPAGLQALQKSNKEKDIPPVYVSAEPEAPELEDEPEAPELEDEPEAKPAAKSLGIPVVPAAKKELAKPKKAVVAPKPRRKLG